jgi:acyl-CoA thioester hydrolase
MMNKNPFELTKEIEIQGYDIDYGGVVSNIVYIRWMDDMRTALLKDHYPTSQMAKDGIAPVVNKTAAHYKRPAFFGDRLTATIRMNMLAKVRWEIEAEIINGEGKTVFSVVQSGAFINLNTGTLCSVPKILADKWATYLSEN